MSTLQTTWQNDFYNAQALFDPLRRLLNPLADYSQWPNLDDYNRWSGPIFNAKNQPLKFIPQQAKTDAFDLQYEPRIFLQGEVQTREKNWHDFFNLLVWYRFPKTKALLNRHQYQNLKHQFACHSKQRTATQNRLAHFDESGAIVISDDASLLELIREHQWQELFWKRRQDLKKHLRCIVFGHGIYEKALKPYIGMTTQTLLLHKPIEIDVDQHLSDLLTPEPFNRDHFQLHPFPILGMPGWDKNNENLVYYKNTAYFRTK